VKELEIAYDAAWRTVTVASQTYSLPRGNLFVVRYDESWRPKVTQINTVVSDDAETDEVIDAFKFVLPEDETVQRLP